MADALRQSQAGPGSRSDKLVALYPGHIWKEDYLLFPMAGKVLTDDDRARLTAELDRLDAAFGVERLRRFEEWADALDARALRT